MGSFSHVEKTLDSTYLFEAYSRYWTNENFVGQLIHFLVWITRKWYAGFFYKKRGSMSLLGICQFRDLELDQTYMTQRGNLSIFPLHNGKICMYVLLNAHIVGVYILSDYLHSAQNHFLKNS